jgi:Domain of unknown function (DUF4419)
MDIFDMLAEELEIANSSVIFDVSDVKIADRPLLEIPYQRAVKSLLTTPDRSRSNINKPTIEACSQYDGKLVASVRFHPLVAAIHLAFDEHRPLSLSPDMMWLLIAQGLANHINCHAKELRSHFVEHQGKLRIIVRRDDFCKGNPNNDWSKVFTEFSSSIRQHIGDTTHDLLVPTFSTTGIVEKAASEIVLLDAMQSYFEYEVNSRCGIPQIQLEGTLADWQLLLERTKQLAQFKLGWWFDALTPILEQFIMAMDGKPDRAFWRSIYKYNEGSGGTTITGWITAFFPYLKDLNTDKYTKKHHYQVNVNSVMPESVYSPEDFNFERVINTMAIRTDLFPSGLAKAPFVWKYHGTKYQMDFLGGFVGVKQDPHSLFLRPEIGWVVRESKI